MSVSPPSRSGSHRNRSVALSLLLALAAAPGAGAEETWRGIPVAPEKRCSPYDRDDYAYPQSVEREIADAQGGIFDPYTGRCYESLRETQIEHMVALSEAHDSGLCAADPATRSRFASDVRNLALAHPDVNSRKRDLDAARWLPERNQCWFAGRAVEVRRAWGLTIDPAEAEALEAVLAGCLSTHLVPPDCAAPPSGRESAPATVRAEALERWDDNGNGRITCAEARRHGIAPVPRGHPAYPFMRDGDGDGVVCEGTVRRRRNAAPTPETGRGDALERWDDNRNGRITCAEARRHGIAPVPRGHPAYPFMRDGDGDGVVCE